MISTVSNTIVNANDNIDSHWWNVVPTEECASLIAQMHTANYIIENHCIHCWKNKRQTSEFRQAQLWLCATLSNANVHGAYIYVLLASGLGCGALALSNDPELKYIGLQHS